MVEELQEPEDEILRYIQEKEFPEAQINVLNKCAD